MSNPTPKLENLTHRSGQPIKGHKRIQTYLSPELLDKIDALASQQDWKKNYIIEQYLRAAFGLNTDYPVDELDLIAHGTPIE